MTASVFAWQVYLTGEPARIHDHLAQEIIVADGCLCPISQLAQDEANALVQQHQQAELDATVANVKSMVAPEDLDSPDFDKAMHQAFGKALLKHAFEVVGVEMTLREIGFWKSNPPNGEAYVWKSVYAGQEIRMEAVPGMFRDWRIWVHSSNARKIFGGERLILNEWPRGHVLQILLEMWEGVFGNRQIPEQFELGWLYRQHQRDMRSVEPSLPWVELDGISLRMGLRWLREAYGADEFMEGPLPDVALALEIKDGYLRFKTEQFDIGVKVFRGWIDGGQVSLRTLLTVAPAVVRGRHPRLWAFMEGISLSGHHSPRWKVDERCSDG